jgi:hypothetical protein
LSGARKIDLQSSTTSAQQASSGFQANRDPADQTDPANQAPGTVQFNQYNNSPKALSSAEIYRQTKNVLSKAKEVVSP